MLLATFLLVCSAQLLVGADAESGLGVLLVEGEELHASLRTLPLDERSTRHVQSGLVHSNPQLSNDAEFVGAISRSGFQGRMSGLGVGAALWAIYRAEADLGLYGLEANSPADAVRLEGALRRIWAHNVSVERARIHRRDEVLVVVWHDGVSPAAWVAVNAALAERLGGE